MCICHSEAIDQLDAFKSDDAVLQALAFGGLGDAFSQLESYDEALGYYDKATKQEANDFTTPKFLLKAAKIAVVAEKYGEAVAYLERLNKDYPTSKQNTEATTLLAMAKAAK